MNDHTWKYIVTALDRASAYARSRRYSWKGRSCYLVSALALDLVMTTRHGGKMWMDHSSALETSNPDDINLAYADHYLDMRGRAGKFGPKAGLALKAGAYAYDG